MFTRLKIYFSFLAVLFATVFDAKADEIIFSQLSTSNGLSSNFVNCIGQSENGYLWVGTENGLQRYDGYRFTPTVRSSKKNRLPPLPVHQVLRSADKGKLWVRMGQTIGLFNIADYTFFSAEIENEAEFLEKFAFEIYCDRRGNVYLLIRKYGVYVYDAKRNKFVPNKKIIDYPKNLAPMVMKEDASGNIWMAGTNGVACYDLEAKRCYTPNYNPKNSPILQMAKNITNVINIVEDSKNRFFINCWPKESYKTYLLDPKKGKLDSLSYEQEQGSNYYELNHIIEKKGVIWGFGFHSFNIFDEKEHRFKAFYDPNSFTYGIRVSQIYQMFEDRDRNLWIATDNGLYMVSILKDYIRNGATPYFQGGDILFVNPLTANRFIMGSWGGKIKILKYDQTLHVTADDELKDLIYKNLSSDANFNMVWCSLEMPETNELWLGCQLGRLIRYDAIKKKSQFIYDTIFNNGTVRCIVRDREKNIYFSLQNGRIIKRTPDGKFRIIADFNHFIANKIVIDNYQNFWISTIGRGLFYFNPRTEKIIRNYKVGKNGAGLSSNYVKDFLIVNDTLIAVACSANLNLLNPKTQKIKQITMYDGLPQQTISSMQLDKKGFLWMSTSGGICRFDPKTKLFRMYDQKDGLRNSSNLADLLENSAKLPNGMMIFAGVKNFMIFDPAQMNTISTPKKPIITEFKLFNNFISVDSIKRLGGIELAHNKNSIAISFASLNYLQSSKLKYYYRLVGANENWTKVENGVSATFASLAPGKYIFMVKAQNSDGIFSAIEKLKVNIIPAFYQTWWFVFLLMILATLPIYFIYKLRLRRLIEVQRIREKVARDLHDDMGSTLTSINILSEMAGSKLPQDPKTVKDYLGRISKNSSQMMEAMDDIVWSIKPTNDQLPRIVARMREYAATILEPQDIRYSFNSNDADSKIKLDMDERRNLFLIFKEALNNISKYAQATKVDIRLNHYQGFLILEIEDNGIGFDLQKVNEGNGILNMKKRTELLKGKIDITTKLEKGTYIGITLPIT